MHRDLKPSNVMVDEHCSVIVCDFGMARSITSEKIRPKLLTSQISGESEALTASSTL